MKQSGFQFANPIISRINYMIHPNFTWDKEEALTITNSFKTNISRKANACQAIVELSITIGNPDETKEPFFIEMTIGASFRWEDAYTEDTIRDLLSINAPALLLGYARPIVSTITSMSPYPAYDIPFYNFTR